MRRRPHMIDVKTAVKNAMEYVAEIFGPDEVIDVRLEEVERSEDGRFWFVTVGFDWKYKSPLTAYEHSQPIFRKDPTRRREFKRVKIDANTGEVESVTIRSV